jgi:membrane protease YdiL (CAAX protease family)
MKIESPVNSAVRHIESPEVFKPCAPLESGVKSIFFGMDGLRAGWRLLTFLAIVVLLLAVFVLIRSGGVQGLLNRQRSTTPIVATPWLLGGNEAVAFFILCVAGWTMTIIEHRKFSEYGLPLRQALGRDFWRGALWGFMALSGTLLTIFLFHGFRVTELALHGSEIVVSAVEWGIAFIFVGLFEEFICRGYAQYTLASGIGFWPAALVISGLFGLLHAFNPGETVVGAISAGLFGLVFCLFLRRTGNLWIAVGFHAAWDWGQTLYGVADSGMVSSKSVFHSVFHGPDWLTGGTVGPEASIFTPIALLVVALIFNHFYRGNRYELAKPGLIPAAAS